MDPWDAPEPFHIREGSYASKLLKASEGKSFACDTDDATKLDSEGNVIVAECSKCGFRACACPFYDVEEIARLKAAALARETPESKVVVMLADAVRRLGGSVAVLHGSLDRKTGSASVRFTGPSYAPPSGEHLATVDSESELHAGSKGNLYKATFTERCSPRFLVAETHMAQGLRIRRIMIGGREQHAGPFIWRKHSDGTSSVEIGAFGLVQTGEQISVVVDNEAACYLRFLVSVRGEFLRSRYRDEETSVVAADLGLRKIDCGCGRPPFVVQRGDYLRCGCGKEHLG